MRAAVTLDRLLQIYADLAAAPMGDLTGWGQTPEISRLRNEAIWVLQQFAPGPFSDLGRLFGGRSVKAIDNAIDTVAIRIATDRAYADRMRALVAAVDRRLTAPKTMSADTRIIAAAGVLADPALGDADARLAALRLLRDETAGASHG